MNPELAQQLKDAGFVIRDKKGLPIANIEPNNPAYILTLEELIEACWSGGKGNSFGNRTEPKSG
jgi:hypothetical protein